MTREMIWNLVGDCIREKKRSEYKANAIVQRKATDFTKYQDLHFM